MMEEAISCVWETAASGQHVTTQDSPPFQIAHNALRHYNCLIMRLIPSIAAHFNRPRPSQYAMCHPKY